MITVPDFLLSSVVMTLHVRQEKIHWKLSSAIHCTFWTAKPMWFFYKIFLIPSGFFIAGVVKKENVFQESLHRYIMNKLWRESLLSKQSRIPEEERKKKKLKLKKNELSSWGNMPSRREGFTESYEDVKCLCCLACAEALSSEWVG